MRRVAERLFPVAIATAVILIGVTGAIAILHSDGGRTEGATRSIETDAAIDRPDEERLEAAPANATTADSGRRAQERSVEILGPGTDESWHSLSSALSAQIGLAVAPLGPGSVRTFGPLQVGHAWSSIKVPILVTLMRERGSGGLSAEERQWARDAITASDNTAAGSLFKRIEADDGGLSAASLAVQSVLREAGDRSTTIATDPPPPGAVSTYGQSEWSLASSVDFFRALGRGCLLDGTGTAYVRDLMEEVVPEQRWGLDEASFPPTWTVAMKGGWGPEGSAEGPYLVRQAGIVSNGSSGVAVAMMSRAGSGSFEDGVQALDQIATWLRENLHGLGAPTSDRC